MSVNRERPQKCKTPGCDRSAQRHGCLCEECWRAAWRDHLVAVRGRELFTGTLVLNAPASQEGK